MATARPRIMRSHGEFCHRCNAEIAIGEKWYRYDGVRCTDQRKLYHFDTRICYKNIEEARKGKS